MVYSAPPGQMSNELWALSDRSGRIYLWWPVFAEEVTETGSQSGVDDPVASEVVPYLVYHAQWFNGVWEGLMDVMKWPRSGRLTSVVVDPQGILHGFSATDCLSYVTAPHDQALSGLSWSKRSCLDDSGVNNPTVAQGADGTIYVVYTPPDSLSLRLAFSKDYGVTWSSFTTIAETRDGFLSYPALSVDEENRLHLVWQLSSPPFAYPPLGVFYARSDDGGNHWTSPIQIGAEDEGQPAIAAKGDEIHVIWNGDVAKKGRFYRYSRDGGDTWSPVEPLIPSREGLGGLQRPPAIIIDNQNHVHVLLHDQESLYYQSKAAGVWSEKELLYVPERFNAKEVRAVRMVISGGNTLHAFYTLSSLTSNSRESPGGNIYRIFHQSRLIDAKAEQAEPWPASTSMVTISPTPPAGVEINLSGTSPSPLAENQQGEINSDQSQFNPSFPIVMSTIVVLVLLGVIAVHHSIRR